MSGFLVIFHTPSNTGYAMTPLERTFYRVACELVGGAEDVHFAFSDLDAGLPTSLPEGFDRVIALNRSGGPGFDHASRYIREHNIRSVLCFDLQPRSPLCTMLRRAGVKTLVSYWGSTISSMNSGLKLLLKRLEVRFTPYKPDLFIFESDAMRQYGVSGRGIAHADTCVIPTGVDSRRFAPDKDAKAYVEQTFGIPGDHMIAFYSGHMEERKGVRVIIEAAIELADKRGQDNISFLICGNRPGEEQRFLDMLDGRKAKEHVIFAGYRNDLDRIMPGCDCGVIASTGWDSFPMSSLEMASCGLPIIVSSLQGLVETLVDGETGFLFEPGNGAELADKIAKLSIDKDLSARLSNAARQRILEGYTLEHHEKNLCRHIGKVMG